MKVIILDMKKLCKRSAFWLKFTVFILLLAMTIEISGIHISESQAYAAAAILSSERQTVIIDAGHGGEDCGAIGADGVFEKDLNLSIAKILGEELSKCGFAVVYTRTDDRLLYTDAENIKGIRKISDLKNRCKIGAEYPNAIFVSIHMNSYKNPKYSGLQVYYGIKNESSYSLAMAIQNSVKEGIQPDNSRTVKKGKDVYILENLDNTAVLVECGFISNRAECEKLSQKEYQKQLSFRILCGIIEHNESLSEN